MLFTVLKLLRRIIRFNYYYIFVFLFWHLHEISYEILSAMIFSEQKHRMMFKLKVIGNVIHSYMSQKMKKVLRDMEIMLLVFPPHQGCIHINVTTMNHGLFVIIFLRGWKCFRDSASRTATYCSDQWTLDGQSSVRVSKSTCRGWPLVLCYLQVCNVLPKLQVREIVLYLAYFFDIFSHRHNLLIKIVIKLMQHNKFPNAHCICKNAGD